MSENKDSKVYKSPLFWGIAATISYLLGFAFFLSWIGDHPWERLSLNETGDFFAGVFAPLAFVWLVVAVFLQRSELQAQRETLVQQMEELQLSREELKLNRRELELNRQAIGEQSIELKKQSETLDRQAKRLQDNSRLAEIDAELERILTDLLGELNRFSWKNHAGSTVIQRLNQYGLSPIVKMLADDQFAEACRRMTQDIKQIIQRKSTLVSCGELSRFCDLLRHVLDEVERTTSFARYFQNYELQAFHDQLIVCSQLEATE